MLSRTIAGPLNGFLPGPRVAERAPAGWSPEPPTRLTLTPLTPTIGAVVEGVDLSGPVDDELFAQLDGALLEWKVLFFRAQHITGEQQATFAANWGPLETHPFYGTVSGTDAAAPEVVRLEKGADVPGFENVWHSDVTWRVEPSLGSVLRAIDVPAVGGDTLWADMGAAYDRLTPATGRRTLYVNRIFTQHIVGLDADESAELLEHLYLQAGFPEYQCRWSWQQGDVAFWDNRSTQHYAASDYFPQRRVMERITVCGDRPR